MARLTMSALERASRDPSCWREPTVHRALLVSGLSVLTESMRRLQHDLETMPRENISGDDSPSVG
ncbi:hypothetical protein KR100_05290 [Synechococcus sp. KORDI-100]|nr:hypothetical protein KR100_05290 [Synechococcus sp. KORDI-100]